MNNGTKNVPTMVLFIVYVLTVSAQNEKKFLLMIIFNRTRFTTILP